MKVIFGGKAEGKTALLKKLHVSQTYNFWISNVQEKGFDTIDHNKIRDFQKFLTFLKTTIGDVIPLQNNLAEFSLEEQKKIIEKIEIGKQKFPACKIACYDKTIKEAYEKAGVKYDGYVLYQYTISIIIDDIDKKALQLDIDELIKIIYDLQELNIKEVLISQTVINTRFLASVQGVVSQFIFLRGCDKEGFVNLYQKVVSQQDDEILDKYSKLQKYQTISFTHDQEVSVQFKI